jgi:hypothetical protein
MRFATNKGCRTVRPLSSTPDLHPARLAPLQQGTHMVIPWVHFLLTVGSIPRDLIYLLPFSIFFLILFFSAGAKFSSPHVFVNLAFLYCSSPFVVSSMPIYLLWFSLILACYLA